MNKLIYLLMVAVLTTGIVSCSNTGAKNYDEIKKYSVKCVEKVLKKITSQKDPGDLFCRQIVTVITLSDEMIFINLDSEIGEKLSKYDYNDIVIAQTIDTVMQGDKFCYSTVDVKFPDSSSCKFLIKFDGEGTTGTEGKAYIRATRGLVNGIRPNGMTEDGTCQIEYSHTSDLTDCYEQYCADYAIKEFKKFILKVNGRHGQTLYPQMKDFNGYVTTDSLEMPSIISFAKPSKDWSLDFGIIVTCGDILFVYDGEEIVDSYGLFDGLGYSTSLHPNEYATCSGAEGVMNRYFGNYNISDRQTLENINKTHKTQCTRYRF